MTKKEAKRLDIINRAIDGLITVGEASVALGISERQVQRLKKKVRNEGPTGVIHKNTGRTPSNAIPTETKGMILSLVKTEEFSSCNFCHLREILSEQYEIDISYSCLHNMLNAEGIKSPKKRRRFKKHRHRARRENAGVLLQVDASPYCWFKDDSKRYSLHGAIDDATGQITALYMTKNECLAGYFNMLRRTINNYGIPCSIYADRHTIFQSPNTDKAEFDSSLTVNDTQLGRALKELNIDLIAAKSPQAKGRIERLWQTLQSRLPVEFAIHNITTVDEANSFLESYIYAYNSSFAVEPKETESLFRKADDFNLDAILCVKEKRKIDNGGIFSYKNKLFKVVEDMKTGYIPNNAQVDVLIDSTSGVRVLYKGTIFDTIRHIAPKKEKIEPRVVKPRSSTAHAVPEDHYYLTGKGWGKFKDSYLSDDEILKMLDEILYGSNYINRRAAF